MGTPTYTPMVTMHQQDNLYRDETGRDVPPSPSHTHIRGNIDIALDLQRVVHWALEVSEWRVRNAHAPTAHFFGFSHPFRAASHCTVSSETKSIDSRVGGLKRGTLPGRRNCWANQCLCFAA